MNTKIVAVIGVAAFAMAGCGSSVAGSPSSDPAAVSGRVSPVPEAPSSAAPSTAATPAPNGDSSTTPTGTTLTVGQTATVLYETKDLSKETTKLEVTATSVKKGAISDLRDFNLDAQTKVSDPFYVTVTFRNAGPNVMEPGGIFGLIEAHNPDGDELSRISLIGDFKKCNGNVPDSLAVGASYTDCQVYIAPTGQSVDKVVFGFYLESDRTEITWKAG